jgi:hypothetical protein
MKRNKRTNEANDPGVDVFNQTGINKKLNNLLGFDDFEKTFEPKRQKPTKRTDVGLDVINECNLFGNKKKKKINESHINIEKKDLTPEELYRKTIQFLEADKEIWDDEEEVLREIKYLIREFKKLLKNKL